MKIGDRNGVQDPRLTGATAVEPRTTTASDGGARDGADHLSVSDLSRALAKFFGTVAGEAGEADPGRAAKLAALQDAVDAGRYAPDPEATARKLLLDELA